MSDLDNANKLSTLATREYQAAKGAKSLGLKSQYQHHLTTAKNLQKSSARYLRQHIKKLQES